MYDTLFGFTYIYYQENDYLLALNIMKRFKYMTVSFS